MPVTNNAAYCLIISHRAAPRAACCMYCLACMTERTWQRHTTHVKNADPLAVWVALQIVQLDLSVERVTYEALCLLEVTHALAVLGCNE